VSGGALVDRFTGGGRTTGAMRDTFTGPTPGLAPSPSGVVLDSAAYQLDGQPPGATSDGWGDMGWLLWRRRLGVRQVGTF
jgi:hypothetical protein